MNRAERRRLNKAAKKTAKSKSEVTSPEVIERSHALYNEALAMQGSGKINLAIQRYKQALKLNASLAEANNNLGNIYEMQNQWPEAEAAYRRALRVYPENVMLLSNLGNALLHVQKIDEAYDTLLTALKLEPDNVSALNNIGLVLAARKEFPEAVRHYRHALELDPRLFELYINLSAALEESGEYGEAREILEKALSIQNNSAVVFFNLGHVLNNLGDTDKAVEMYREAIKQEPDYVQAYFNLAHVLRKKQDYSGALHIYQQLLEMKPGMVEACLEIAAVHEKLGQPEQALGILKKAATMAPKHEVVLHNMAFVLFKLGQTEDAIAALHKAIRYKPNYINGYMGLGEICGRLHRYAEAIKSYRRALELKPSYTDAYLNLAGTVHDQGNLEQAIAIYREALRQPRLEGMESNFLYSNYLLVLNYSAKQSQAEVYQAHRGYADRYEREVSNRPVSYHNDCSVTRKLKIGYVSADFREHSVAYYIEPLLAHYDPDAFEVYCYSDVEKEDAFTARFRGMASVWREALGQSHDEIASQVRADGIDILVDLNGHTGAGPRMLLFARKPAPVQVSYLGYPNTTGLSSMDYRLTDAWADPPDQDQYHSEQLVRLDKGFLCYQLPASLPEVCESPVFSAGHITFGSFNNLAKMVPEVIALWAQVLKEVSGSRLLMKNLSFKDPAVCADYRSRFARHGIGAERLELVGWLENKSDHLTLYNRIDICLDTFPYNGTTTTCEALSMGVPVITLCGQRHAARVGNSLLHQIGLTELVATTEADYLLRVRALAENTAHLQALRSGIRGRMQRSPLCNGADFTKRVEAVYRQMWAQYCRQG